MFSDANNIAKFFRGIRWEGGLVLFVIHFFPEVKMQQGADVLGHTGKCLGWHSTSVGVKSVVKQKTHIADTQKPEAV